jgi:hypothetical protein
MQHAKRLHFMYFCNNNKQFFLQLYTFFVLLRETRHIYPTSQLIAFAKKNQTI